ncbi:MAG TPA: hypothetical protein VHY30_01535 [Verrucomicrobiae bacterium]|jgi:hypothetical protein|nr:hypothetical protein [Verrucomicrobiae bacterium]
MKQNYPLNDAVCARLGILPTRDVGSLKHGQICLANDDLFSQETVQTELTTFGIGYADPNRNQLMSLLNYFAPKRPGPRNVLVTQYDETEPFEAVDPAKVKRAELGDFHTVKQRSSTKVARRVINRGLAIVLDNDQLKDKPNWEQMHTMWLIDLLTRASIIEVLALFAAFAPTANLLWNNVNNPDLDINSTNIQVLALATGFKANRACYGEYATLLRRQAYEGSNNPGGYAGAANIDDAAIATRIGVATSRTNVERYNQAGVKDTFLGSKVLLYTAIDGESPEDASNVVRHVSNTDLGGEYSVYVERKLKKTIISVENYEVFATQHTSGAALLTVRGA